METIWHFIVHAAIALALTGAAFLAVNVAFFVCGRGNPRIVKSMFAIRRTLRDLPTGTVLECKGLKVSALIYDRTNDRDATVPLYTAPLFSPLTWSGGQRSAKSLYGRARAEVAITAGALLFVALPLFAVGIDFAINVSWLWWFAVIILAGTEIAVMLTGKFIFLKWSAFSELIPVIILHRYHLYPLPVAYSIGFGFVMLSILGLAWMERSSASKG
jgi:hypothetical protein